MLKNKLQLTEDELLNRVSDQDIFKRYFGDFEFDKCYPSIFRKDANPSTGFYVNKGGYIIYNDLATDEKLGAINFVCKLYNLSFYKAIEKIAKDFNIIEGVDNSARIKPKRSRVWEKTKKVYEVTKGKWRTEELAYWQQFAITQEELEKNNIFPCRELTINGFVIENPQNYVRFVYIIYGLDGEQHIKVYSPHDPVYKWMGSAPKSAVFGWNELQFESDILIISKGQKDRLIWKKYFTDVIAPQSESKRSLPEEVIDEINQKYKPENVYVSFDNDNAGKEGTAYLCETYGWKSLMIPDIYREKFGIKDFADLVKERGLETFEKYIKWTGLKN